MNTVMAPPGTTRVCRLCLTDQGQLHPIFGGGQADLAEQIYDITAIEIADISGIPSLICELCRSQIIVSHRFVLQCRVSDMNYRKLLERAPARQKVNYLRLSTDSCSSSSGIGELAGDSGRPAKVPPKITSVKLDPVRSFKHMDELRHPMIRKVIPKKRLEKQRHPNSSQHNSLTPTIKVEPIDKEAARDDRKKQCPKCNRTVIHLRHHFDNMHTESPKHVCRICGKIFKHLQSLGCHMNNHNGIKPYSCKHCGKSYSHPNSLYDHEKYHEKRYRCSECDAAFTHVRVMKEHVQTYHPE